MYAGWDTPGTGMNFFIHNMCRLPGADGTWMIVKGGMGSVTQVLAAAAKKVGKCDARDLKERGTHSGERWS